MNLALPWRRRPSPAELTPMRRRARTQGWISAVLPVFVMLLGATLIGFITGVYGNSFHERPNLLLALPLMLALGVCFAFSRTGLLLAVLFFRALLDPLLASARMGTGPGLGGVVNGLILLLVLCLVFDAKRTPFKEVGKLWLPLLGMYVIGILFAPHKGEAIRSSLAMLTYPATFLVGARLTQKPQDFTRVAFFIVASAALVNLYALVGVATNEALWRVYFTGRRLMGGFPHPNIMAFYEVMIIALAMYLLNQRAQLASRWKTALTAFVMLTALATLLLTQTRSAWLATFVLFLLYSWFVNRKLLPLILIAPLFALLLPEVRDRLMELQTGNEAVGWAKLNSYAWRKLMWTSAIDFMGPSKFITGYGLGSFVVHSPTFFPLAGRSAFGAHNVYVQLLFELGIGGVLALVWLMGSVLLTAWRMQPSAVRGLLLFLVIMFLIVCWSDNMLDYLVFNIYLFYVLGAGWSLGRALQRETPGEPAGPAGRAKPRRRHPPPWSALPPPPSLRS